MTLQFSITHQPGDQLPSTEWNAAMMALIASLTNVKHHGAYGNGVNDDTAAITAAYAYNNGGIFFPPGSYKYNAAGLPPGLNSTYNILGASPENTIMSLGAGSRLALASNLVSRLNMGGLDVQGGKGLYYQSFTGSNVYESLRWENLRLYNYTEAAVATEAVDSPYHQFENIKFQGASPATSMGIALNGYTDQGFAKNCQFITNRAAIKLCRPVNFHTENCDMLQFNSDNSAGPRVGYWLKPAAGLVYYGEGVPGHGSVFKETKFGATPAEGWQTTDHRHLFADEGSGATIGTRYPILNADSTGYIQAVTIDHPYMAGGAQPIIYTTTPNVRSVRGINPVVYSTPPSYWIQYRTPPTVLDNNISTGNSWNRFDQPIGDTAGIPLTNSTHGGVWDSSMTAPIPASSSAAGIPGQRAFDANYEYRCVAPNTWKRSALATW